MNEKFKIQETKIDGKEVSIFKVSKECKSMIETIEKYTAPTKHSEHAVYFQLNGWGWRKKIYALILKQIS